MKHGAIRMNFQIFVIFHKQVFPETFEKVPEELRKHITFVAVNPEIPKEFPPGISVMKEWELPIYEPRYQAEGFNENSVFFHLHMNGILDKYDYVGFCQYDMILDDFSDCVASLQDGIFVAHNAQEENSYSYCLLDTWAEISALRFMEFAFQNGFPDHTLKQEGPYPLLNTYIVPSKRFQEIVKWAMSIEKEFRSMLKPDTRPAGAYERLFAFAVGELFEASKIQWRIQHRHDLKELAY